MPQITRIDPGNYLSVNQFFIFFGLKNVVSIWEKMFDLGL